LHILDELYFFTFSKRYGDEYEFGVAYDDQLWTAHFRVRPGLWVNIFANWDPLSDGLTLMVNGAQHSNQESVTRDYQQLAFDAFMDVVVGLNADGTELLHENRFEIAKLSVYDWTINDLLNVIGMSL
jgi:hypothetical protein